MYIFTIEMKMSVKTECIDKFSQKKKKKKTKINKK